MLRRECDAKCAAHSRNYSERGITARHVESTDIDHHPIAAAYARLRIFARVTRVSARRQQRR